MNGEQYREMTYWDVRDAFFTLTNQTWGQTGPSKTDGNSKRRVSRIKPLGSVMNIQHKVKVLFSAPGTSLQQAGNHKVT